jgi:aldose sugar dehydrogenase
MAPVRLLALVLAFTAGAAAAQGGAACVPLERREPNAAAQKPAFAGQTRACPAIAAGALQVDVVATGLEHPWAVEPLPDGDLLVTERPGRMRIVGADGKLGAPLAGLPPVAARGQGGLLDVALSPRFASDRTVYWSYAEPREGGNGTSVARAVLSADRTRLEDVRVILRSQPTHDGGYHFGSRLAFGPDGMLYVTLGERADSSLRPQAQQLSSHLGKVLRIRPDGSAPPDNPFVGRAGARAEIWSLGHRNVQAAAFDAEGRLWTVEMGARGGDELNRVQKGANHGWPDTSYGVEYSGRPIGEGVTARPGIEQPVYYWDPSLAPSGAQWYDSAARPAWRGSLFVGALAGRALIRLTFDGSGRVSGEERLLADRGQRIRDVRQGADGVLWVVTDEARGELWKLTPLR